MHLSSRGIAYANDLPNSVRTTDPNLDSDGFDFYANDVAAGSVHQRCVETIKPLGSATNMTVATFSTGNADDYFNWLKPEPAVRGSKWAELRIRMGGDHRLRIMEVPTERTSDDAYAAFLVFPFSAGRWTAASHATNQ